MMGDAPKMRLSLFPLVVIPEHENSLARTFGRTHSEYAQALNQSEKRTGQLLLLATTFGPLWHFNLAHPKSLICLARRFRPRRFFLPYV